MGLVGLRGGGFPAMDSTAVSTSLDHPLGTVALDSSGGEYVYCQGVSSALTSVTAGTWVVYNSSLGYGKMVINDTAQGATNTYEIPRLGIVMSGSTSSNSYHWAQIFGRCTIARGETTLTGPGVGIRMSATNAGLGSTAVGRLILGARANASAASTIWDVSLVYPYLEAVGAVTS